MGSVQQKRVIKIVVDAAGVKSALDSIASSMGSVTKSVKTAATGMQAIGVAAGSWASFATIRTMATFSDEIQNINNRLISLGGTSEDAANTMDRLVQISRNTKQSISGVADSYLRMSAALKDVGVSQETLLNTTQTIANTFRLSGATTDEARNATIQLGQAFSLGALRGQDLRSVMSQNVYLTRLLRKEFGTDLLKSAEKGLITTAKLFEILNNSMHKINSEADLMKSTFEQSLTRALDTVKLKIFELADAWGLQSKFAKGVDWFVKNIDKITPVLLVLGTGAIAGVSSAIIGLAASIGLLSPGVAIITALAAALIYLNPAATSALGPIEQLDYGVGKLSMTFFQLTEKATDWARNAPGLLGKGLAVVNALSRYMSDAEKARLAAYDARIATEAKFKKEQDKLTEAERLKQFKKDWEAMKAMVSQELDPKEQLRRLNEEFRKSGDVAKYNKAILAFDLSKANYQFKEGTKNLSQLRDAEKKVTLNALNQGLADGTLNIHEFNEAVSDMKMKDLNEDLAAGTITLAQYNSQLAALSVNLSLSASFKTGVQDYITSVGTLSQGIAGAITNAFKGLETVFFDFVKTGKISFKSFTQSVLDDLTRIIVRSSIVAPLAQGLLNFSGATTAGAGAGTASGFSYTSPTFGPIGNAKGNAFDSGIKKFASGGIVNSPTMFGYGGGTGLMGEAGPEAILPLQRGKGGNLGVAATVTPVTVNVINQSGNETKQVETTGPNGERQIDIIITNKVKEGIANGRYDTAFKQSYGLTRKGS